MPRLLNINNYHYHRGGAEAVYLGHGAIFAEAGWTNDWFAMKHPSNLPTTDESHFAELIDLEHMHSRIDRINAAAKIIYNTNARRRMAELLDKRRPDIAHAHNIYHHLSPSILGQLKQRGVPVVLTAHDLKLACPSYKMLSHGKVCERCRGGRIWNVAVNKCLKNSHVLSGLIALESAVHKIGQMYESNIDRVVAPSIFYRNKLIEWGWDAEKVVYIPNFSSDEWGTTPVPDEGPLLYFGRLSEEKGVATLIRASRRSGVPVVIAGTGPQASGLLALAEELEAPVKFAGYCTKSELATLFSQTRAVILPSEWYENAPMSILEAYSAGRPVIGANIGGIPEMIHCDETGWTFPAGDVDALAARMKAVSAMPSTMLGGMGNAGRIIARGQFSVARYFESMSALYATLGVTT